MKFSDEFIINLMPLDKKYYIREKGFQGFTIRVMPSGKKYFFYIYTFKGRRRHLNLGCYPCVQLSEARKKYSEAIKLLSRGIDPKAETTFTDDEDPTVAYIVEKYLEWSAINHSTAWNQVNYCTVNAHILPVLGKQRISIVNRRIAIHFLEQVIQKGGKGAALNAHRVVRSVFDYALQREYIANNPFIKLAKAVPALRPKDRIRVLSEEEIKTIWHEIDAGPGELFTKRAVKLVLVTAQRPGEIAGMHGSEVDGVWWTIPGERTKSGRTHRVYLTPSALELIGNYSKCGYVFPSPAGNRGINPRAMSRLVATAIYRTGRSKEPYYGLPKWTPHDLRRTARTQMAKLRVPREHAEAVLNHAKEGMVKVYDQYEYEEEKKVALLRWEEELLRIVG